MRLCAVRVRELRARLANSTTLLSRSIGQLHDAYESLHDVSVSLLNAQVDLFFSEFLYKKHCLWRQRGLTAAQGEADLQPWGSSLSGQIRGLRLSKGRQLLLTRFLAGRSWASCSWQRGRGSDERRLTTEGGGADFLRTQALANSETYELVGFLRKLPQTLRLLQSSIGWPALNETPPHANPLSRCVSNGQLPPEDVPTAQQRAEVSAILREDIALYEELEQRFDQRYRAKFGTDDG